MPIYSFSSETEKERLSIGRTLLVLFWSLFLFYYSFPDSQGTDFYPLYQGGKAFLEGRDPYSEELQLFLRNNWTVAASHHVAPVVAYPLPLIMLVSPFALFELPTAIYLWWGGIFAFLIAAGVTLKRAGIEPLLLLLFFPLFHALTIKTSSVIFFSLILITLYSDPKNRSWGTAFLTALLSLKPQIGCFFWLLSVAMSLKSSLPYFRKILICTGVLWLIPFLYTPGWIEAWQSSVRSYSHQASLHWMIGEGFILSLLSFPFGLTALASTVQTFAFPLNDLYSALPLFIVWLQLDKQWLKVLIASSWGALLLDSPNSSMSILYFCYLPLLLALITDLFLYRRKRISS